LYVITSCVPEQVRALSAVARYLCGSRLPFLGELRPVPSVSLLALIKPDRPRTAAKNALRLSGFASYLSQGALNAPGGNEVSLARKTETPNGRMGTRQFCLEKNLRLLNSAGTLCFLQRSKASGRNLVTPKSIGIELKQCRGWEIRRGACGVEHSEKRR
jgi:hypothetical protein